LRFILSQMKSAPTYHIPHLSTNYCFFMGHLHDQNDVNRDETLARVCLLNYLTHISKDLNFNSYSYFLFSFIGFTAMPHCNDVHNVLAVIHCIDYTIVTNPNSPQMLFALQLASPSWARVFG